jgi:hypothetical protein
MLTFFWIPTKNILIKFNLFNMSVMFSIYLKLKISIPEKLQMVSIFMLKPFNESQYLLLNFMEEESLRLLSLINIFINLFKFKT